MCIWLQVQKEINQLAGKLDRVFTMTDELVYKDARKDEARRQAYKMLASLRDVSAADTSLIKSSVEPQNTISKPVSFIEHFFIQTVQCTIYEVLFSTLELWEGSGGNKGDWADKERSERPRRPGTHIE